MTSHCIKCGEPFKHPPGRYTVCPSCKAAVARAAKKRWKKEKGSIACGGDEGWLRKLCVKKRAGGWERIRHKPGPSLDH